MPKDLTIQIKENDPDVIMSINNDGIVSKKVINIDDLSASFASGYKISTDIIPKGTRYFSGSKDNYVICIETVARKRNFLTDFYGDREEATRKKEKFVPKNKIIPFPTLVFNFLIIDKSVRRCSVFAVKQTLSSLSDYLYNFPFSNVYDNGNICWGANKMPKVNTAMDLTTIMMTFMDAPFNGDLISGKQFIKFTENGIAINDFWSLLRHLETKETFPENCLVKYKTLKTILNEMGNS